MALKKQTAFMIHLLFLVLFLVGSIFVYFNENYGRGLNWVREENYADTYSPASWNQTWKISSNTSATKTFWKKMGRSTTD